MVSDSLIDFQHLLKDGVYSGSHQVSQAVLYGGTEGGSCVICSAERPHTLPICVRYRFLILCFCPNSKVISERDILGTQLVRRNDELALLYEKIKIQQSTLAKGEMQYRQRLEDVRLLKLEIKKLRREKNILNKSVANVDDLRYRKLPVKRVIYWRQVPPDSCK